jgi:class 3 adenylate cyclase
MKAPEDRQTPRGPQSASSDSGAARGVFARLRHDVRTRLDQILGYSELLEEEAESRGLDGFLPDLHRIRSAGEGILELVDGLLEVPEPEAPPTASASESTADASGVEPAVQKADTEQQARLLVVDDDEPSREMLARRLRKRGHEVEVAESGRAALHMIESTRFDLVLLDFMMPGMTGIEMLEKLRPTWSANELPVIMVTGKESSKDMVEAFRAGANDYVTKPVDLPVALARIRTQLALKRASEALLRLTGQVELRNQMIRQVFGRYLTDEVVEGLLEHPEGLRLGGEKRRITVLFADLRGFTTMAEKLPPEKVVTLINGFLAVMSEVIMDFGGTIDEFLGDAILVLFGAPVQRQDHARAAVACAVQMQLAMEEVNRQNRELGLPEIEMGIGISTGEVVVGNIGSERRAKYGVVGHTVNLAARIQAQTRGGQILIAESTLEEAKGEIHVAGETEVTLKGVPEPVRLYEVGGIADTAGWSEQ